MTRAALARLYPGETPRRGEIRVELREAQDAGVAGVIAAVAGLLTGAAGPGGFKGLAGPADLRAQMQAALTPDADAATRERFAAAWQDWVRTLLVEHGDDPRLIEWQH